MKYLKLYKYTRNYDSRDVGILQSYKNNKWHKEPLADSTECRKRYENHKGILTWRDNGDGTTTQWGFRDGKWYEETMTPEQYDARASREAQKYWNEYFARLDRIVLGLPPIGYVAVDPLTNLPRLSGQNIRRLSCFKE